MKSVIPIAIIVSLAVAGYGYIVYKKYLKKSKKDKKKKEE